MLSYKQKGGLLGYFTLMNCGHPWAALAGHEQSWQIYGAIEFVGINFRAGSSTLASPHFQVVRRVYEESEDRTPPHTKTEQNSLEFTKPLSHANFSVLN